ncbi:hypothetical protein PRIPAC_77533 [Pristionchus pacificus]|nr:hypothetical protein PRIPAC_77533 [Pristionchus pacificus]
MLMFLSFLPNCDNPTISFYILLLFGILYSGGTCGFYTSILSIAPVHMGTLSSIAAATRIAASVVATLIFNGHNAMVSRNRRFSLHSGNSFEMASRFCFRSSFFSLSLAFISSFLEEPNYRSGEKGPKVSLLTRKWSNSFVSFSFDDKERRHLTLSLPIDSSDKSDP